MVQMKINDAGLFRRLLYRLCLPIGYKIADFSLEQRRGPNLFWAFLYKLADWSYFRPIWYLGMIIIGGMGSTAEKMRDNEDVREFYLGLTEVGKRKSYREVKHYKRRKRWLG